MVKVLMIGCSGKMGRMITETSKKFNGVELVAGVDKFNDNTLPYPIFDSIDKVNVEFDVAIDFSRPETLQTLVEYSKTNVKPLVLCSTGYSEEEIKTINKLSETVPVFKSWNMSLGINLINNVLKKVSAMLFENYDIEIIEKHHNQKVDSPSGTALLLGDTIRDAIKEETVYVNGREGIKKREHKEIGVHAIRGGTIVGEHSVIFAGEGEVIEFKHSALSREVFASGALKAAEFMNGKGPGMYNMDDVLNLF